MKVTESVTSSEREHLWNNATCAHADAADVMRPPSPMKPPGRAAARLKQLGRSVLASCVSSLAS